MTFRALCALALAGALAGPQPLPAAAAELAGFAALPADTFAAGPPAGTNDGTGKPISANGRTGPFPGQPVQGFSGVQAVPAAPGRFLFLSDNGFGGKSSSADYRLRAYELDLNFATARTRESSVSVGTFIQFSDPDRKVPFPIVNENTRERILTGADFDIESFAIDNAGDIWVGDELGPFLLHFDKTGKLLQAPIETPQWRGDGSPDPGRFVRAPLNVFLENREDATIAASRGYEGMGYGIDRKTLYPVLEGHAEGDPARALRIAEFRTGASGSGRAGFTRLIGYYRLAADDHAIGDVAPVNDTEFLVIERDNGEGKTAQFKKIFLIDIADVDKDGFVARREIADLLDLRDPHDLDGDGSTSFAFPFLTIENLLALDPRTLLVANDNNYPFSRGRGPDIDNNEFILIRLDEPLNLDPRLAVDS